MIRGGKEPGAPRFAFLVGGASSTSPRREFLSFGSPSSVVGPPPCIGFWCPYLPGAAEEASACLFRMSARYGSALHQGRRSQPCKRLSAFWIKPSIGRFRLCGSPFEDKLCSNYTGQDPSSQSSLSLLHEKEQRSSPPN